MVSPVRAGMVILCLMVVVVVIAGCTKPAEVKTSTAYSLNRGTNQVEGTLTNDGDIAIHAKISVNCRTVKGANATVVSEETALLTPGQTTFWKTQPLPALAGSDNYVSCRITHVSTSTKDKGV